MSWSGQKKHNPPCPDRIRKFTQQPTNKHVKSRLDPSNKIKIKIIIKNESQKAWSYIPGLDINYVVLQFNCSVVQLYVRFK